jgi:hypothetical protein
MLLNEQGPGLERRMHSAARRWGKGFMTSDGIGYRFDAPTTLTWLDDGVSLRYDCGPVELRVTRSVADNWSESYELCNSSEKAVTVGSLAISTPWRDVYQSSHDSLSNAVHAHVWTGGALEEALGGYRQFVTEYLVRADGTVLDYRADEETVRLYNFPWFARFLLDAGDLDLAFRVMLRFYELGGEHFLAFELGGVVRDISTQLAAIGRRGEADHLTDQLIQQAGVTLRTGQSCRLMR